jgi:hypothetical protein
LTLIVVLSHDDRDRLLMVVIPVGLTDWFRREPQTTEY